MKKPADATERLIQVLAKNAALVAEAFSGPVHGGDRTREQQIAELMEIGALRPYDQDSYYLTGGLHDYFSVALASFHAFQALTRIDSQLRQADRQWDELLLLRDAGSARDMRRLEDALQRTIFDIGETVERNIQLLNTMVMGRYGNVDSFDSKLRQNRYYAREVQNCIAELQKLDSFIERLAGAALAHGQHGIRHLVRRRLGSSLFSWTSRLKDAQWIITNRLFEARQMEQRVRQLSRYAGWLSRNRTVSGWEVQIEAAPLALFRPNPLPVRPQPDVRVSSPEVLNQLIALANKLKVQPPRSRPEPSYEESVVISDIMEEVRITYSPHQQAVRRLLTRLAVNECEPISLRAWKQEFSDLANAPIEHWLLYASVQVQAAKHKVRFVGNSAGQGLELNEPFSDVVVEPKRNA